MNKWENLATIDRENYFTSLKIVGEVDLEKLMTYNNATGGQFTNKIKDLLFHIINHSTYHRAQLALLLREQGVEPINTDYKSSQSYSVWFHPSWFMMYMAAGRSSFSIGLI